MPRSLPSASARRVMVIDDDAASADAVARLVRRLGHDVVVCRGWTEALRRFDSTVDLVLMDAVMPTVDGFKLTRALRGRSNEFVPIVFVTALDDRAAREHGVAAGADDFLTKPVDPLELRVRMDAMLRIRDLTQRLEARSRAMCRLASLDTLTKIGNRRAFDEQLTAVIGSERGASEPTTLLLFDIDHFKIVNDDHGHVVGDQLLAMFGRLLADSTRACDAAFRFGGEEFAVLVGSTPSDRATSLADRLRQGFWLRSRDATRCGAQTVSVGVCGTDQLPHDVSATQLLQAADAALYRAKQTGRNRVCRYRAEVDGAMEPDRPPAWRAA